MIIESRNDNDTGTGEVLVDGVPLDPKPSQKVYNHSPDGFAWGYGGSGPAQLALAILLAAGLTDKKAIAHHQRFKARFIAALPRGAFRLEVDVPRWVEENEATTVVSSDTTVPSEEK